jgi:cytochrome P450
VNELYWDPYDIEIDTNPYPVWKRLRDEAPVYRNERLDFYALSRHADVEAAHRDPRTFSSAHATVLELMGPEPIASRQMIFLDPPDHDHLRALVSRAFTPRRVTALEPEIRQICRDLLDAVQGRPSFDYLGDFGAILPVEGDLGAPRCARERP